MLVYDGRKFISVSAILNRPDVLALSEDLELEFIGHSRTHRWVKTPFPIEFVRACLQPPVLEKSRPFIEVYNERNHRRKNFKNVYKSNNNYTQLSIDWD